MKKAPSLLVVLGTRPEAIKLAPVMIEGRRRGLNMLLCNTEQHREMSSKVLDLFGLTPDLSLDVMQAQQTLTDVSVRILQRLQDDLFRMKPDWVVVQGDTTTTFVAALAAFYNRIPVAHIEAGLRTGNIYAPWPEEMNRQLVTKLASIHFPPTALAATNLHNEGIKREKVYITGNTGIDALKWISNRLKQDNGLRKEANQLLLDAGLDNTQTVRPYILITCHRRESFGGGLTSICAALALLAKRYPSYDFIYPVHPNPQVRMTVHRLLNNELYPNIRLIKPLDYLPFVELMSNAFLILTDSGGIQEEAPSLGKRVIVLRTETERTEALSSGLIRLAGVDMDKIVGYAADAMTGEWPVPMGGIDAYGDGKASERIIDGILAVSTDQ